MDYKQRLKELVALEKLKNETNEHVETLFYERQREVFSKIRQPLAEIIDAAGSVICRKFIGERFVNIEIAGPGSTRTTYDIEPNSVGRFSTSPQPAPGWNVSVKVTYDNGLVDIEPTARKYLIQDSEELLEDLMRKIAKARAKPS